ncbi:sulfatase-like hydrolase/transferase [Paraflavitalea pollutisoli]|uniref:sulfatase-like hydrolase/transferase n=1 Tax=Paraflavitalea pollutisoli TaxID=3034143 RepID=UPI0023EC2CDB|nr:sulfatase-like hydrolase/transferase [Paraflavitalea sp. H1-2-19X]
MMVHLLRLNHINGRKLTCSLALGASLLGSPSASTQSPARPNIIYILADDMGYGDLSYLNKQSKIQTPAMDKLAKEGVVFTDAHSNSAVCTPTRYGILTGRYAFRSSLKKGVLNGYSPALIEPNRTTVASFLQANGYHTACIGKWHLGLGWQRKDPQQPINNNTKTDSAQPDLNDNVDYSVAVTDGPNNHGFSYSYIIPASLDMNPYCYLENNKTLDVPTVYTPGKSKERGVFWRAGNMSPGFDFDGVLPQVIDKSVAYINERAKASDKTPFFLYLPLPAPHTPWLPRGSFDPNTKAGRYGRFVAEVDEQIDRIVQAVEANGQASNTLIIITSDNGSDWKPEDITANRHQANYIYRGRKADVYEAGHRIPFIARWPGKIPAGSTSHQTMCTTDLLATVGGILQQPLPAAAGEDSYNMLEAFLQPGTTQVIREATIHHSLDGFFSIRKGPWKLTPQLGSGGFTVPKTQQPQAGEAPGTLYDLSKDPQEQHNLYSSHPEIVQELTALLERYRKQGYSRPQ